MKSFLLYIALVAVAILYGCAKYERQVGCDLDKMNVNGNVTKIETIVKTTIPLTELFESSVEPSESVSMYIGNTELDFNKRGNVKHHRGYGLDGEKLYDVDVASLGDDGMLNPCILGNVRQKIDIKTVKNNDKVVNAKYFSEGEFIWEQNIMYGKNGNPKRIIKDYTFLDFELGNHTITHKDTTSYYYSAYDSHGNWTMLNVAYRGVLASHAHDYTIFRQLTYEGEGKHDQLINKLASINKQPQDSSSDFAQISLETYGTMYIPAYMSLQDNDYMLDVKNLTPNGQMLDYLFMGNYNKKDAYATIFAAKTCVGIDGFEELVAEGSVYNKELDNYLQEVNTAQMAQGDVYVLKWLPYEFVRLSGKDALKVSYYRFGSPIPVYCENYSIPMDDGYMLSVAISYQSNHKNHFCMDFEKAINSIVLN